MDLRKLSDETLLFETKKAVKCERDQTLFVLHHLREVERRQLFARSHSSLFQYCVEELGYDRGSAFLRISAMRLLRELPEMEEKVEEGALNLTLLTQAQAFISKENIRGPEAKREVVDSILGQSTREATKTLMKKTKKPETHRPDSVRPISDTHSEMKFIVDDELLGELETLRSLLAHSHPGASLKVLIQVAVRAMISGKTPKAPRSSVHAHEVKARQASRRKKRDCVAANAVENESADRSENGVRSEIQAVGMEPKSGSIRPEVSEGEKGTVHEGEKRELCEGEKESLSGAEVKRIVWHRDRGVCTFRDSESGRVCGSRYALEYDHEIPVCRGGETTVANLRLRCRVHNRWEAIRVLGAERMAEFVMAMK